MDNSFYRNPDATSVIPFAGLNPDQIKSAVDDFMCKTGLHIWKKYFIKGAFLAQDSRALDQERNDRIILLTHEKEDLRLEKEGKWRQAWTMWILVGCLALRAAI